MFRHIHSLQNDRIKKAVRLRDRRGRQQQQRIIVDGMREVRLAVESGLRPCELFVCETCQDDPDIAGIVDHLIATNVDVSLVADNVFQKLAFGKRSEGVVLVAEEPRHTLQGLSLPANALVCVLEGLEKPGNLGAVLRTADAAGVSAVIVADGRTDLYNHNAIRASLGAIFRVPVCAASAEEVLAYLRAGDFAIFAARVDGAVAYTSVNYCGSTAVVLGSEAEGLSDSWQGPGISSVILPMVGAVDSLNVSVTGAVLFYEALRQRQLSNAPDKTQ